MEVVGNEARRRFRTERCTGEDHFDASDEARGLLAAAVDGLSRLGLCPVLDDGMPGGNASLRLEDPGRILVTPSGRALGPCDPTALTVVTHFDPETWSARFHARRDDVAPTSDTPLHWALLREAAGEGSSLGWSSAPTVALHGHALATEADAEALGIPISSVETRFSTPEDRRAFLDLLAAHPYPRHRAWIRRGHGFFVVGDDVTEVLAEIVRLSRRRQALQASSSAALKWVRSSVQATRGYDPGVIPPGSIRRLDQNESPFPLSRPVHEAIVAELGRVHRYPESSSAGVRQAAADVFGIAPSQVLVTNGSDHALQILIQTFLEPGDRVVAFEPTYSYYGTLSALAGGRFQAIPLEQDFSLPEAFGLEGVRLVFLPNPNAPTGNVFPEGAIRRLCEATSDGIVVVDEAYADFAGVSATPLLADYPHLLVVRSLSKSHGLAGLRIGLLLGSETLLKQLDKVRDFYEVDRLAQVAAEASLRDVDGLRRRIAEVVANRERLKEGLLRLGLAAVPSGANFLLVDVEGRVLPRSAALAGRALQARAVHRALADAGVLVRHLPGPRTEGFLRIAVGVAEDVDAVLQAMARVLDE